MAKKISKRARHKTVCVYIVYHGNFFHSCSKRAYVAAHDARKAAQEQVANLCRKLGVETSYFTYEVHTLPLVSATKKPKKSKSAGPY